MSVGSTLFVLVTCSLDQSRDHVLRAVVENLRECAFARPGFLDDLLVLDNASTVTGTVDMLRSLTKNVRRADRNVGYWTAVDWCLREHQSFMRPQPYDFVYVIESDMIHYDFGRLQAAEAFLANEPCIGAVRCQEFSIAERHLYDKNEPVPGSRTWAWQSHTHRFTGKGIKHRASSVPGIYETDFLTQLPALNRMAMLRDAFTLLSCRDGFSEPDFQKICYDRYPVNALLDGGIYHCRLSSLGSGAVTGSWTPQDKLATLGYQTTRCGRIEAPGTYRVTCA